MSDDVLYEGGEKDTRNQKPPADHAGQDESYNENPFNESHEVLLANQKTDRNNNSALHIQVNNDYMDYSPAYNNKE